jgi:hypothetical protein
MGQALETLAQQSRVVPTIIFRNPESFSYRMGEEHFPNASMELEELPRQDEDKIDRFLQ